MRLDSMLTASERSAAAQSAIRAMRLALTGGKPGDSIEAVSYACAGNKILHAVFVNTAGGSSFATILQQDELIPMQVAVSGSGARYVPVNVNQTYELLTKGDAATLYEDSDTVLAGDCTAKR